ncbi:unnamed protein product [Vitrella brassicaformis CCMP3155]|uniref:Uncharacterized protein n=2 Tax=Vitrella brassicaformis TaxID=1169539 RepID=A0A0G4F4Q8_VITBC|nr:unnamed protein product [Vitrella brassicaformis CCMP3155]|eukprot:CEM07059.1 unnamed protein product [Vitrella brassicaformis CCMP3155]
MGNMLTGDTIPCLVTMVDVHAPRARNAFYYVNVSTGGTSTKVIGRTQTACVECGVYTILTLDVYECPEPMFTPEIARQVGSLRIPMDRLSERYSSGIFQQWFNLDTATDPRATHTDRLVLAQKFEQAYKEATVDVYQPKVCLSIIASSFEVKRGGRQTCSIFVGEDVKTTAGPDIKALIASHKQQAEYINALHEELRKMQTTTYRPFSTDASGGLANIPVVGASTGLGGGGSIIASPPQPVVSSISPAPRSGVFTSTPYSSAAGGGGAVGGGQNRPVAAQ